MTLPWAAANFAAVERQQNIFSQVANTPAVQAVLRRVEQGGALSLDGVNVAAQPFVVALLRECFPKRTIIAVTAGVKAQESFHQDLGTWSRVEGCRLKVAGSTASGSQLSTFNAQPLFFPAWDILPHESKLPHVDVISERLETLVALGKSPIADSQSPKARRKSPVVVANVVALMQRTFPAGDALTVGWLCWFGFSACQPLTDGRRCRCEPI